MTPDTNETLRAIWIALTFASVCGLAAVGLSLRGFFSESQKKGFVYRLFVALGRMGVGVIVEITCAGLATFFWPPGGDGMQWQNLVLRIVGRSFEAVMFWLGLMSVIKLVRPVNGKQ